MEYLSAGLPGKDNSGVPLSAKAEERFEQITHNLEEVVGEDDIRQLLARDVDPSIYWGTATTGKPHLGYFVPMYKIADFLQAGCHVIILFADLHAFLDNMKSDWELLKARCEYYELIIKAMLTRIGVPLDRLTFVRGTDYQLSTGYTLDMYKMSALVTTEHTTRAGAEVVKQTANPFMSNLLYPMLQALDEQYLGVDIQFGGVDQRKIFMFARQHLPRIGYKKRAHLMNPLIPGLVGKGGKMSSSEHDSKVDFDDEPKRIKEKIKKAWSLDGEVEDNGLLAMLKHVLFRFLNSQNKPFHVNRPDKWGGPMTFKTYAETEAAFASGDLVSGDLKTGVADAIIELLEPLRKVVNDNWELLCRAYPDKHKPKVVAAPAFAPSALEIRVGKILDVKVHPNQPTSYVEQIDVGEAAPRTIVSGLVKFVPIEKMKDRHVLVCTNLSSIKLQGIESFGMVLCTSSKGRGDVDPVLVPEGSKIGEIIKFANDNGQADQPTINKNRMQKVLKGLFTNDKGEATFKGQAMSTSAGICTSTIKNGFIS